jgi:hypothetical protein
MITYTRREFELNLDPNDELAAVELQAMLSLIEGICGTFGIQWVNDGHKFTVDISTVDCP